MSYGVDNWDAYSDLPQFTGWLIELAGKNVQYLKLCPRDDHPGLDWTDIPPDALFFAREKDAKSFAATFLPAISVIVAEHGWI